MVSSSIFSPFYQLRENPKGGEVLSGHLPYSEIVTEDVSMQNFHLWQYSFDDTYICIDQSNSPIFLYAMFTDAIEESF